MKRRKDNSVSKHTDEQPETNEPDGLWEPEDIEPEAKPPKSEPKGFAARCNSVQCSTRLAVILRDSLDPKYQRARLLMPSGKVNSEQAAVAVKKLFPNRDAAERKLGSLVFDAFLMGDKNFPDEVRKAMSEVDAIFNRTRLTELTRRVMPFSHEVDACETKAKAREFIEGRIGKELYDQEWDRLQKHFGWDTLPLARQRSPAE